MTKKVNFQGITTEPMPLFDQEKEKVFKGIMDVDVAESSDQDYLSDVIEDYDALLVVYAKVTRKIIECGKKLKVIGRYGIGTDNIDV